MWYTLVVIVLNTPNISSLISSSSERSTKTFYTEHKKGTSCLPSKLLPPPSQASYRQPPPPPWLPQISVSYLQEKNCRQPSSSSCTWPSGHPLKGSLPETALTGRRWRSVSLRGRKHSEAASWKEGWSALPLVTRCRMTWQP